MQKKKAFWAGGKELQMEKEGKVDSKKGAFEV